MPFSSNHDRIAFIKRFPDAAVFDAARMRGWKFSRGRPSVDVLVALWSTERYAHWLDFIATKLERDYPAGPPAYARTSLPPGFDDDDEPVHSAPTPMPIPPVPAGNPQPMGTAVDLSEYIKRDECAKAILAAALPLQRELKIEAAKIEALQGRIIELEKRAPVQINIGDVKLPPIEGQHSQFARMVKWLTIWRSTKLHPLLVGEASSGKTSAALAFAKMKNLPFHMQPQVTDSFGILGYRAPNGDIVETAFSQAWKHGGVYMIDEMSMNGPDALGALNAALSVMLAPLPGVGTVPPHADFYCIAADNSDTGASLKYSARSPVDGATFDRFIRIEWNIDRGIERSMSAGFDDWLQVVWAVRDYINSREIQHVGATTRATHAGAVALKAGVFSRMEILEDTLRKGILCDNWDDVLSLPAVKTFLAGGEDAIL